MNEEIKNAVISSAEISKSDHGILDCWLYLDYGGMSQGFGGYALYLPKTFEHHDIMSVAGHHIFRILEIAGVEEWSKLKGKTIRVKTDGSGFGSLIKSIGHIVNEDWYCPKEDFSKALENK
jgi:hypothetical protein